MRPIEPLQTVANSDRTVLTNPVLSAGVRIYR